MNRSFGLYYSRSFAVIDKEFSLSLLTNFLLYKSAKSCYTMLMILARTFRRDSKVLSAHADSLSLARIESVCALFIYKGEANNMSEDEARAVLAAWGYGLEVDRSKVAVAVAVLSEYDLGVA